VVESPAVRAPEEHSLTIRNPSTGETIRTVAITSDGEIAQKVARARAAQPAWAARSYDERAALMRAFRDLLEAEADECAAITHEEMGKPAGDARTEIVAALDRIDWNLANVGRLLEPRDVTTEGAVRERVTYEPVGVVAHISAWNYPYFVALNSIIPALLAGNAVLYKPSELATLTGLRLVDLMHRAGLPVDVVHAVVGGGATGSALIHDDVDMICFTGSVATGKKIAAVAAERLVRVQLELGGKDGAYVADDVDIDAVAMAVAEGAFYNAGQSCAAIERVYVHDAIYDRFLDAFVTAAEMTDIGPLARAQQTDVLAAQVADAAAKGARVVLGGERIDKPGNWFAPTVVADVNAAMRIMRDESFGPVVGVQRVRDDADAIAQLDHTEYGLGAAVFTNDRTRAERILAQLDVGNAYWNVSDRSSVRLPWAGRRNSGFGVSMSESGIRTFLKEKAWHLKP
jgi:acyl-CoA reductase-like NAD-dependent aldehyde dehydrogenase